MEDIADREQVIPRLHYLNWRIRLGLSLLVGHLIVVQGQPKSSWILLHQLNYWLALCFSALGACVMMYWVNRITKILDIKYPWYLGWRSRIFYQTFFGVIMVLLGDFVLVRLYFWLFHGNFRKSGFMIIEFPIIQWMVISLNLIYMLLYFVRHARDARQKQGELALLLDADRLRKEEQEHYAKTIMTELGNKTFELDLTEVVCFLREENSGFVHTRDGHIYNIDKKMDELLEMLYPGDFVRISRSVIIGLSHAKGYEKVKNQQALVVLQDNILPPCSLLVSRSRMDDFKEAWMNRQR